MTVSARWTPGRIATTIAVIAVVAPGLMIAIEPKLPGGCDMTPEWNSVAIGLTCLGFRGSWIVLKWINDAFDRRLAACRAARSMKSPYREL